MTAILVTSERDLAIAAAAVHCGVFPADQSVILVATLSEAAELDRSLVTLAEAYARVHGVQVLSLNDLIRPRHPLDWRMADLSSENLRAAMRAQGLRTEITHLAHIGRRGQVHATLRRLLDLRLVVVADSPELATAAVAQHRREVVLLSPPWGVEWSARRRGAWVKVIPRTALRRVSHALVAMGASAEPLRFDTPSASWLWRYLRSDPDPLDPAPSPAQRDNRPKSADEVTEESLDFVIATISDIDSQRHESG